MLEYDSSNFLRAGRVWRLLFLRSSLVGRDRIVGLPSLFKFGYEV